MEGKVADPLVSVIVVSYNAAEFIIETLESVKAQTYQNIELIVSDDASKDSTVGLIEKWLMENGGRFSGVNVMTVSGNTGISANCNRSILAAKAAWVKFLAGDDVLLPNCIQDNIRFVQTHPNIRVLFSTVKVYSRSFSDEKFVRTAPHGYPFNIMSPAFTAAQQFQLLLVADRINFTPSNFLHRQTVLDVGGFETEQKIVEDYPLWIKMTRAGHKLHYMDITTVGYRQHENAINNRDEAVLIRPSVFQAYPFRRSFVHNFLPWDLVGSERFVMFFARLFERFGWNRNTYGLKILYRFCTVYLNPFQYLIYIRRHFLNADPILYS